MPEHGVVQAIGPDGLLVAERILEGSSNPLVEEAARALRIAVRRDTERRLPRIVVLDANGKDITDAYEVN